MYQRLIRPFLFALSHKDPEEAHIRAINVMKRVQRSDRLIRLIERLYHVRPDPVDIGGVTFPNRIGLAAGFDKQGEVLTFLQALGFGFIEVGSVLPHPQPGNPRPRMFRFPEDAALCNRMGFNSDGANIVAERLQRFRPRKRIPIGGSLGKQKDTPIEDAAEDYVSVMSCIAPHVDYYVANVSSPNTLGLRQLQARGYLEALTRRLVAREANLAAMDERQEKPIFLKLAPDLSEQETEDAIEAAERGRATGIINGNTTLVPPPGFNKKRYPDVSGGFSGRYTFPATLDRVKFIRKRTGLPIVACGGVWYPDDVAMLRAGGADLIQVFTGLIYQGPSIVRQLRGAA